MFKRILLPTDFSSSAHAALTLARSHFPEATRLLLHVLEPKQLAQEIGTSVSAPEKRLELEEAALARLRAVADSGEEAAVRVGGAADIILEHADAWNADLIVMGTHGRTGLAHFLNGSVAEQVVRHARRPVLIEHERADQLREPARP